MDQAAGRDSQSEVLLIDAGDLAEREPILRMQDSGGRCCTWTNLGRRRPQGIRRLQRVPPLDASATCRAVPNVDVKLPHDGAHDRQFFLILRGNGGLHHRPATVRTGAGDRRVVGFIDLRRHGTVRFRAVGATSFAAWALGLRFEWFRKRSGLSESCPAGFLELSPQVLVLLTQSFVLALQPIAVTLGPFGALAEVVRLALGLIVRLRTSRFGHAISYARIAADVQAETRDVWRYRAAPSGQKALNEYDQ
jgi:hypothetical protein